ncbi:MAG: hypothetical protein ABR607_03580 [Pyrinomonadaceae bacterium]
MNSHRDRLHIFQPGFLLKRLDFGSVVIAPYVVAILWQYFCALPGRPVAWILTLTASSVAWLFYLSLAEAESQKVPRQFWIVVAGVLLFFYLIRLPFPDLSFDVLNYHIFHGERALRGPLLLPRDFFPTPAPFNPTPDILTGLYRHALGYRLGTIVNYLALIWTGTIVNRLLRDWVRSPWLRCAVILFVLTTEQLLFQINNYMVDLLALPLLLEATFVAIKKTDGETIARRTIQLALLLGAAAAFKLANLLFAVPIVLVYIFNVIARGLSGDRTSSIRRLLKIGPIALLASALPLLPFTVFIYRLTGNPVFPLYNGLFKSPYWPQGILFDPRWGPYGIVETLGWPVIMLFRPWRLSEYGFYSGRLSIGFVAAAILIVLARRDRQIWQMAFITLSAGVLWSASSGYIRYALYLELTSGILLVWLVVYARRRSRAFGLWGKFLTCAPLSFLLFVHAVVALSCGYRWEWSARPTIFAQRRSVVLNESRNLLRDRSLAAYLAPEDRALFADVDVWIETTYKTSAIEALLKPTLPAVGVRMPEYFAGSLARKQAADVLRSHEAKRMFTFADRENFEQARNELAARGLAAGNPHPVTVHYFSGSSTFDLLLVEVSPKGSQNTSTKHDVEKGTALADSAFKARLSVVSVPSILHVGQEHEIRVVLKNESDVTWPGRQATWQFQMTVGDRWLKQNGEKLNDLDGRAVLFDDLPPGGTAELPLQITAPNEPGIYILQVDAIQEGVAWFGDRGSEVLNLKIRVQ